MPFTPYHFGPSSWLGLLFNRYLDFLTFLIASVIIDIEPFIVIVFNLHYPLHGYFHTVLGATIIALLLAGIMNKMKRWVDKLMLFLSFHQKTNFRKILIASFTGTYLHILLDAPLYNDIHPFYPFTTNPFYGLVSASVVHSFCAISFIIGIFLYLIRIAAKKKDKL